MDYIISETTLNAIAQYLGSRPYNESARLIALLQGLKQAPTDTKECCLEADEHS